MKALIVSGNRARDQGTRSPIELFWTANKNHEDILFCLTLVVSVVFDFTLGGLPAGILQRKNFWKISEGNNRVK